MPFKKIKRVAMRKKIATLDLEQILEKALEELVSAQEYIGDDPEQQAQAMRDYRHFLYLLWFNRSRENRIPVVPTKRADALWHAHLLFNYEYNTFSKKVFGEIVPHKPGLKEGSQSFLEAQRHTKVLHDEIGSDGFEPNYFSHVEVIPRVSAGYSYSQNQTPVAIDSSIEDIQTTTSDHSDTGSSGSSFGSSCGGGCGGGCGG